MIAAGTSAPMPMAAKATLQTIVMVYPPGGALFGARSRARPIG
jgi:hypothetical protein